MRVPLLLAALALTLAGCGKSPENPAQNETAANAANAVDVIAIPEDSDALATAAPTAANATNATVAELPTEGWLGRWNGPEGLFLDIGAGRKPGIYKLTIKDSLDDQADYEGRADGAVIRFNRAGKAETIRGGTGSETGFKWLAEKKDCLIVVTGKEGYCR